MYVCRTTSYGVCRWSRTRCQRTCASSGNTRRTPPKSDHRYRNCEPRESGWLALAASGWLAGQLVNLPVDCVFEIILGFLSVSLCSTDQGILRFEKAISLLLSQSHSLSVCQFLFVERLRVSRDLREPFFFLFFSLTVCLSVSLSLYLSLFVGI